MSRLNRSFRPYSCSSNIDYFESHWILHINSTNECKDMRVIIGTMTPMNLFDKI